MLEASIALDEQGELGDAISEHRAAVERSEKPRLRDTGERDRTRELRGKSGWAWLRPVRRLDEYQIAILELEELERRRSERERELV